METRGCERAHQSRRREGRKLRRRWSRGGRREKELKWSRLVARPSYLFFDPISKREDGFSSQKCPENGRGGEIDLSWIAKWESWPRKTPEAMSGDFETYDRAEVSHLVSNQWDFFTNLLIVSKIISVENIPIGERGRRKESYHEKTILSRMKRFFIIAVWAVTSCVSLKIEIEIQEFLPKLEYI